MASIIITNNSADETVALSFVSHSYAYQDTLAPRESFTIELVNPDDGIIVERS